MRLLIVDDNRELAEALAAAFLKRDIRCDIAGTARDAEQLATTTDYAAMVLDLGLPDEDGLTLLRRLRAQRRTVPVIVLSARGAGEMRVLGLESGADDYLVKPFLFVELHARLSAILRRQGGYVEDVLRAADLTLDTRSREVRAAGAPVPLSVREIELLELLMRRAGHVVPKRVLADQLFGAGDALGSNAVDVYVHRVRRKLEDCAAVKVQTVRGIGYMLSTP
ncbi:MULTISPECIES: response regulator transcription factor [unclassified Sphingomonas]|uniref:response regulator n=1 Tax=unclassified Sphingomonas TaxID=196159 RepID=UPI00092A1D37|nr:MULTISPECIES: response regulator transcription factor [unclassified Sphingomonas]MBN8847816.1 response regulator transcription factor [Sphingomonas sp.]OJV33505.1 MAG: DNA-binding response regulator [Sphingomonas sp. 67-36]